MLNNNNLIFYHGTSSKIKINKFLLPPSVTNNLRENRIKNIDVVFLTKSIVSAEKYAKKACLKYKGKPIVYRVLPIGYYYEIHNAEIICNKAKILNIYE